MKKLPPEFKLRYNNRRGDPNYSCYYELLYCEGAQESIIAKYYEDKYETENQILQEAITFAHRYLEYTENGEG